MEDREWEKIYLDAITRFVIHHPIIFTALLIVGIIILGCLLQSG